jgi:uncharacterized protein (TIGR03067 family)
MNKVLAMLSVVVLLSTDKATDQAAKRELDKLQGTWSYVAFEMNGEKMPDDQLKKMSITYTGDKWTVKEEDRVVASGTQKLDPSKTPHEIDSPITEGDGKGITMLGIYEFKGDTFKVCFDPSGQSRPKSFTPKEGQFAAVIKRQKK